MSLFQLKSQIQNYAWGSTSAIPELVGRGSSGLPEAELWMGAHPALPSPLAREHEGARDLRELISLEPLLHLGRRVAESYGQLPFLFKVLAAASPLSLQAHPGKEQARDGYLAEERRGIAPDAPERIYKDRGHKPELIYALTRFTALSGFRERAECLELLSAFGCFDCPGALPALCVSFSEDARPGGLELFFRGLFSLSPEDLQAAVETAQARAKARADLPPFARRLAPWVDRLATLHPRDPGVLAALLLHLVELEPGQAMYLPAGNLHAYLEGTGLEVMASSDNVMRGGLTQKHVDVTELCRTLSFEPYRARVQSGDVEEHEGSTHTVLTTEAQEFELSIVDLRTGGQLESEGAEIWLVLEGTVDVSGDNGKLRLSRGEQLFCSDSGRVCAQGDARMARTRVPLS